MAAEGHDVIGIKFGVLGGKSIDGWSGDNIKKELTAIAEQIMLSVKVQVDEAHFKGQLEKLKSDLDKTLGELTINIKTKKATRVTGGGSGEGGKKEEASYDTLRKTLEKIYKLKVQISKASTTADGKQATVQGEINVRTLKELEAEYERQKSQLEEIGKKDAERTDAIKAQVKQAEELKAALEAAYREQVKNQTASAQKSATATPYALAKLGVKASSLYTDNGYDKVIAQSQEAMRLVNSYNEKVREMLSHPETATKDQVAQLNTEFLRTEDRLKQIQRETDNVWTRFKEAFGSRIMQQLTRIIMMQVLNALRQVYQNVKKIDEAMTQLRIVTNASAESMEQAAEKIAKSARKIGASIADLVNSTTIYARLGYGLADAQTLAEKTTMYASVAGVNVEEATQNITGLIKAFNIGANGLESVLDQLIFVGNSFPVSQAEIGEAINNAGSALEANGNSLQQSIGIITAANASLQNVAKASTAVRTIAARISNSTAELQELGEEAGIYTTNVINAKMQEIGVTVAKANGEIRSTYDVLNDLSKVWSDLTAEQQASIANMLAGLRSQNAFYSIMNNWADAEGVVARESEAVGALASAHADYLDSIGGRIAQLSATWEDFSQNILDSQFVKVIVSALTGLVTALDWIASWFPATEVMIGAFAMVVLTLGKKIGMGIAGLITKVKRWGQEHGGIFKGIIADYKQTVQEIRATKAAIEELQNTSANPVLTNAMSTAKMTTADMTAMYQKFNKTGSAMVNELTTVYGLEEEGAKAMAQWAAENDRLTTSLNTAMVHQAKYMQAIVSGVMSMAGIILSIANATKNNIVKLCAGIVVAIAGIVTAIVVGIKTIDLAMKTNVIFLAISLAVSAIMMIVEAAKALMPSFDNLKKKAKECKEAWQDTKDTLEDLKDKIKEVQDEIDNLNAKEIKTTAELQEIEKLNQELADLKQSQSVAEELAIAKQRDAMNAAEDALDKYREKNTIYDSDTGQVVQSFDDRLKAALKDRTSSESQWAYETIKQYEELLSGFEYGMNEKLDSYFDFLYKLRDMYTAGTTGDDNGSASAFAAILTHPPYAKAAEALKEFANTYTNTAEITQEALENLSATTPEVKELFDYLKDVGAWDGNSWGTLAQMVGSVREQLSELASESITDGIASITDKFDTLNSALEDLSKNGVVGLKSLEKLMSNYPSLLKKYFKRTADGYQLVDSFEDINGKTVSTAGMSNFDVMKNVALEELKKYQETLDKAKETLSNLKMDDDDYETALKNVATAQDNLNNKTLEWSSILRELKITDEKERLENLKSQLEKQLDIYKELIDIRKDLLNTYKEEINYQKELSKKQKAVADLQTQLALAKMDKSASGQARARELESQLQDAKDALDEYTLERAVQDISTALDNEYSEYEAFIKEQTDGISEQITNIVTELQNILGAVDGISNTNATTGEMYSLYKEIQGKQSNGMTVSGDTASFMSSFGSGNYKEADKYYAKAKEDADNSEASSEPAKEMSEDEKIAAQMTKIKGAWGKGIAKNSSGDNGEVHLDGKTYHVESKGDDGSLYNAAYGVNKYGDRDIFYYKGNLYGCLDGSIVKLGEQDGWSKFWNGAGNDWENLKRATGMYHTGGFVGDFMSLKSNEEFAKLLNGELVSTPKQMDDFMKRTLPALVTHNAANGAQINNNAPLVEITCGRVDEDTLPKLKDLVNEAVRKIEQNMEGALQRIGYKKRY